MPDWDSWGTVVDMIARRYKIDPVLNGTPHPKHWIGPNVWRSPEYLIYRRPAQHRPPRARRHG